MNMNALHCGGWERLYSFSALHSMQFQRPSGATSGTPKDPGSHDQTLESLLPFLICLEMKTVRGRQDISSRAHAVWNVVPETDTGGDISFSTKGRQGALRGHLSYRRRKL
jgi:hypothetical protein